MSILVPCPFCRGTVGDGGGRLGDGYGTVTGREMVFLEFKGRLRDGGTGKGTVKGRKGRKTMK